MKELVMIKGVEHLNESEILMFQLEIELGNKEVMTIVEKEAYMIGHWIRKTCRLACAKAAVGKGQQILMKEAEELALDV